MILCDRQIKTAVISGQIGITPFDPDLIQPASIDVRLGSMMRRMENDPQYCDQTIDLSLPLPENMTNLWEFKVAPIYPGEFMLAHTMEKFKIPSFLCARLEGKSSLGRLGLLVHATAGFFDPGFEGEATLELYNATQFTYLLHPGMRIGQMAFQKMDAVPSNLYGSAGNHYQGQSGPQPSRYQHKIMQGST